LNIDLLLNSSEQYISYFNGIGKKSVLFPNAYPDDLIFPTKSKKNINIGFCGNIINREKELNFLDKFNIQKDIFVIGNNMVNSINSFKIHFNKNIADDINYRTFETTGCSTLLLTNYTPNLEKLFKINEEIVVYDSLNDLNEKVLYLLNNEKERIQVEIAGYKRSKKDHTYNQRAKFLLEVIKYES